MVWSTTSHPFQIGKVTTLTFPGVKKEAYCLGRFWHLEAGQLQPIYQVIQIFSVLKESQNKIELCSRHNCSPNCWVAHSIWLSKSDGSKSGLEEGIWVEIWNAPKFKSQYKCVDCLQQRITTRKALCCWALICDWKCPPWPETCQISIQGLPTVICALADAFYHQAREMCCLSSLHWNWHIGDHSWTGLQGTNSCINRSLEAYLIYL